MKAKPIIFNGEMVRAILDGRKTQTRRVIKPQPPDDGRATEWQYGREGLKSLALGWRTDDNNCGYALCRYGTGKPGTLLWVRETHHIDWYPDDVLDSHGHPGTVHYRADLDAISQTWKGQWRPSIHMPRWASRLTLRVLRVWVERVQDISAVDAMWEGVPRAHLQYNKLTIEALGNTSATGLAAIDDFAFLWDSINAKRGFGWDVNPFVWCVEFEVAE